jgi:hypothetical protein
MRFLEGPAGSGFPNAFTPADFAAARSGPAAQVVVPISPWIAALPEDPQSQWISTAPDATFGHTALFAIDFTLIEPFDGADVEVFYAVDNMLGDGIHPALFLNGTAANPAGGSGDFYGSSGLHRLGLGGLLHAGQNTLYLYVVNDGGPGAAIFQATINTYGHGRLAISSLSSYAALPGSQIAITGTDFDGAVPANNHVSFNGVTAPVLSATATSIVTRVPDAVSAGPLQVAVGGFTAKSPRSFSPVQSKVEPIDGNALGLSISNPALPRSQLADLDGDGRADVIDCTLTVYRNVAAPGSLSADSFAPGVRIGPSADAFKLADLDGDGKLDVIAGCPGRGGICVFRNTSSPGQISFVQVDLPILADGDQCFDVFVGDADGDGRVDFGGRGYFGYLPLFHNLTLPGGAMAFERSAFPEVGGARAVAFCDLDGDGKDDLAVRRYDPANALVNDVTIYRAGVADGSPVFTEATHVSVTGDGGIAVGDLDGDGRPDLAFDSFTIHDGAAHPFPGALVTAVRNLSTQGQISFGTPQVIELHNGASETYAPLIADLNGDGRPEIVVATGTGIVDLPVAPVSGGGFELGPPAYLRADLPLGYPLIHDESAEVLCAADLDGDGRADLVFTGSTGAYFYRNTMAPVPALNGFSKDAAPAGTILTINGQNFGATPDANVVRFGNVLAVVLEASGTTLKVIVPPGAGDVAVTVTVPGAGLSATSGVHFHTTYTSSRTIDSTTFGTPVTFASAGSVNDEAIGDFDGDGKPDVVLLDAVDGKLVLLRNVQETPGGALDSASLVEVGEIALPAGPQRIQVVDVDGDGRLDLAVVSDGKAGIYRNVHAGGPLSAASFASALEFTSGVQLVAGFQLADLDHDGLPDLMLGSAEQESLVVLRNTSTSGGIAFGSPQPFHAGSSFQGFAIGDIDGDGFADLVTAQNNLLLWRNTSRRGQIEFSYISALDGGGQPADVRLVDLDGDQRPELVWTLSNLQTVGLMRNIPRTGVFDATLFGPRISLLPAESPGSLAVTDLDGDSAPEIIVASAGAPGVTSVFRNIGAGSPLRAASFAPRVDFASGLGEGPIAAVDLDGDGKPELLSPNGSDATLSILQNRLAVPNAAFFFSAPSYSAGEGSGALSVTIQRNFSATASVSYHTSAGSAVAPGDFTAVSGMLSFAQGELSKTINVPIIEDTVYEGDESFQISLSGASAGSVILAPGQARLIIIDNDAFGPTPSITEIRPPDAAASTRGSITVTLAPAEAAGQWRLLGENAWRESSEVVRYLLPGNYLVEYRPIAGYERPEPGTVVIAGNDDAQINEFYDPSSASPTGSLNVSIQPADLANAAVEANRGQWREQGTSLWHDSGDLLSGLPIGPNLIEFKPVPGRATPPLQSVPVSSAAIAATAGIYYLADAGVGQPVTVIDDATADGVEPYVYMGQIKTDTGAGSGFAVLDRTVLTAAHVLFDDLKLTYTPGTRWYLQRTPGGLQAPPLVPRGAYVFDGYAAQRALDHSASVPPGTSTPASQNLDVAAMYFEEPAARNGFGGFLRSNSDENEWLQSARSKMLAGYPVEGVAAEDLGRLHASAPITDRFDLLYTRIYRTDKIHGFPGCSGGPLLALLDNGRWYPAGIYLGGTGQTLIRAIDSPVVDLINRAQDSADSGANNTGNGVTLVNVSLGNLGDVTGTLNFQLYPAAINASARWSLTSEPGVLRKSGQARRGLPGGRYTITFAEVPGFIKPADREVQVSVGTYVFSASYAALSKPIITSPGTARGTKGRAFSFQVLSSNGADTFTAAGLPGGLRIDAAGKITGSPKVAGAFAVTVRARNAAGETVVPLQITVNPPGELLVSVAGGGMVTPGFLGFTEHVQGQSVTITASPARGFVFAGFTGDLTASTAKLTFVMPERLELVANFIPSPFTATAGSYYGLATRADAAGSVVFTAGANGAATMACKINGQPFSFQRMLAIDGSFKGASGSGATAVSVDVKLDLTGLTGLSGTLTAGGKLYSVQAYARGFDAVNNPATAYRGRYTLAFQPNLSDAVVPQGIGAGSAVVDAGGTVTFTGTLGDGTKIPLQKTPLSKDGIWPILLPAYGSKGSVAGFATLSETPSTMDVSAILNWNKPATPASASYHAPFTTSVTLSGNRYTPPATGQPLLTLPDNGAARLTIGAFIQDFTLPNAGGTATVRLLADTTTKPPFVLTFNFANGLFSGTWRPTPDAKPIPLNGAVLQGALRARGLTRSADGLLTLPVEIHARP